MISSKTIAAGVATTNKAIVTAVDTSAGTIDVAFYDAQGIC